MELLQLNIKPNWMLWSCRLYSYPFAERYCSLHCSPSSAVTAVLLPCGCVWDTAAAMACHALHPAAAGHSFYRADSQPAGAAARHAWWRADWQPLSAAPSCCCTRCLLNYTAQHSTTQVLLAAAAAWVVVRLVASWLPCNHQVYRRHLRWGTYRWLL